MILLVTPFRMKILDRKSIKDHPIVHRMYTGEYIYSVSSLLNKNLTGCHI